MVLWYTCNLVLCCGGVGHVCILMEYGGWCYEQGFAPEWSGRQSFRLRLTHETIYNHRQQRRLHKLYGTRCDKLQT